MSETWMIWKPLDFSEGQYELIQLQQDWNGVKLIFDDEKYRIEVIYKVGFLALRSCDEGDRWKTVDTVLKENGGEFYKEKLFFKVKNSDFKNWYIQESFAIRSEMEFEHHAYVTANDIIDILSLQEPEIILIKM